MAACHDEESWFKSSKTILDDLSVAEAVWKTEGHPHSIWEIANHLIYWNEMWLSRFINEDMIESRKINNEETFELDRLKLTEESWRTTIRQLSNGFAEWRDIIANCEVSKLERRIPSYFNAPWWNVVSNLCIHNAYHIGQMMFLKKLVRLG
nr:DinB family protein [Cohnella thailandensis]